MIIKIKISTDYTKTPGGRFRKQGKFSGEDFREVKLIPSYKEALEKKCKLLIDFDGGYGYAVSFLEEAFGGLVRKGYDVNPILSTLEFTSNEDDSLIERVTSYIKNAKKQ